MKKTFRPDGRIEYEGAVDEIREYEKPREFIAWDAYSIYVETLIDHGVPEDEVAKTYPNFRKMMMMSAFADAYEGMPRNYGDWVEMENERARPVNHALIHQA